MMVIKHGLQIQL